MFNKSLLGELEEKFLYQNIDDFYMGVFSAYDANDFEHELDMLNASLKTKVDESGSSLTIETKNTMNQKRQSLMIYEKYDILIMTGLRLVKDFLYDETVIGNVDVFVTHNHSMNEIDSLSFELGKEFGQKVIDVVNFFKSGIGKEILDSVTLFFVKNWESDIDVKISSHATGEISFSAKSDGCRFSSLIVPGKDKYTISHECDGIIAKIKVRQETLDDLKNGIVNIT